MKPKANKRGEEKKKETQWKISWLVNVKSFYERFIHIVWIICTNNLTSEFKKKKNCYQAIYDLSLHYIGPSQVESIGLLAFKIKIS